MTKPKFVILANESPDDHLLWLEACKRSSNEIDVGVVNLVKNNWYGDITNLHADYFLSRPPGISGRFKQLYDERLYILDKLLNIKIFPTFEECIIYENKRLLASWLMVNNIPHPHTWVFYNKLEAESFVKNINFPIVAKVNIGASGSGVTILYSINDVNKYIHESFSGKGSPRRWGPNFESGGILKRGAHYLFHPKDITKKLELYRTKKLEIQKGFVILQEYISHDFEWRVIRIGDSFFAHKKIKANEKASGSLLKAYENPPLDLLDFVKDITDKFHFFSQAIDIFEDEKRGYLINEMQCFFGQSDPYQMLVNGKPGRYFFQNEKWVFEEGDFASNACYDLRLKFVQELINKE